MRELHETLSDDELAPLLHRLTTGEAEPERPPVTTVRDVAEATGMSEEEVRLALREMRRARLSEELRILEEPLYRVERPGHVSREPFPDYLSRERTLTTLLDRRQLPPKTKPVENAPSHEHWVAYAILIPLVGSLVYFLVRAILAIGSV